MKAEIRWKNGYRAKVSADAAYAEIERIREENDGQLTPEHVVEAASESESPLHDSFEWNNRKAGHQWRLAQARSMIRSFVIVDTKSGASAPAFLNIVVDDPRDDNMRAYLPTAYVVSRPELRERAVEEALKGLQAWQRRHGAIAGFEPVHRAIKKVSRALGKPEQAAAT